MAGEWRDCLIGDIADVIGGSTPSTKDPSNFDGDVPWLTPKDLSGPHDRYVTRGERNLTRQGLASCSAQLVPAGTVLLSSRAPIGYVAIAKNPIATNQGFRNLLLRPGSVPGFLYYWLTANVPELERHSSGSTFKELSGGALKQIQIRIPPEPEQRAIAHILGTLDDKIELNRRMNETLEAMARALFKSWFVDFDPVRAKAQGRDPGLPKSLADLFPDSIEDSELGEIPKGWRAAKLGDEVATVLGGTPSRTERSYWGGDIPWINSGKANEFRVVAPSEFITKEGLDSSATKLLPTRTTVIAITGATLGQVSLTEIAACANQSIVGVIGNAAMPSEFLYFWVKSRIDDLLSWQTGGAQQHINKNNVNDLGLLVPGGPIIRAFVAQARPCFDRIKQCCLESRTLAALRDALLPKLISGQLRVNDPVRLAEETAWLRITGL